MTSTHWKRLSSLVIGLALVHCARCLPEVLKLGGLFGEGAEEGPVQNAFRYAVYRINHETDILPGTVLEHAFRYLPETNTFAAARNICSLVESKKPVAIFGPRSERLSSSYVSSMCASLQLPHLENRADFSDSPVSLPHGRTINLYPPLDQIGKAYSDLILSYGWSDFLVIHGATYGLRRIERLLHTDFGPSTDIVVREVNLTTMRATLKEAKDRNWKKMVVDLDVDDTTMLLKMALQEGMIDPYHHYILTDLDIECIDMEDFRHNYVNLTGFRLIDPSDPHVEKIIENMKVYQKQTELSILNFTGYLSMPHEVGLMYDAVSLFARGLHDLSSLANLTPHNLSCEKSLAWPPGPYLYSALNKVRLKGVTGDIRLRGGRRTDFKLNVLQLMPKGLIKSGDWVLSTGLNISHRTVVKESSPFGNRTLVVTSIKEPPFVMDRELPSPDEPYEGFIIDLTKELSRIVGFKYRFEIAKDYGSRNADGEWDGMVREIMDGRADMAVAPLTITYLREQFIDFTKPFLNLGISIVLKKPRREKPGLFSFLNPLAKEIWLYIVGAYLMVSFTIFLLARFSPYEWYNPHPCNPNTDEVENTFDLANSLWFTVGTLMQQGSDVNPRAVSTRIVGGTWWVFTLIIISSYTANLAAFLTVERMVSPVDSAEDLVKQTTIEYGTRVSSSTISFFKESNIETYRRIYNYMKDRPHVLQETYEAAVAKVKQGNYAFFMENLMIDYQVQRDCQLMQVGGLLDSKGYGIGLPMNSAYRESLSMAILELQEAGTIQMMYNKWWKDTGSCMGEEKDTKANALGVDNVGGIFVVLLMGLALAVMVAIFEFIYKSRQNAKEDKQSLCTEMGQELRFATSCGGSSKRSRARKVEESQELQVQVQGRPIPYSNHRGNATSIPPGFKWSTNADRVSALQDIGPESSNGLVRVRPAKPSPSPVPCSTRSIPSATTMANPGRYETEFRPDFTTHKRTFNGDYQHVEQTDADV